MVRFAEPLKWGYQGNSSACVKYEELHFPSKVISPLPRKKFRGFGKFRRNRKEDSARETHRFNYKYRYK